eukprot:TRINITY_DN1289_c0_g1_i1.p1 TRINITY_DN1289_c0_g1~~TRINITY_DN1289_c0_g1_i1.p1  ORF type:complete len:181 (-),score=34.46 TRINITY_DN1289_c0_g1_i1:405-947(-)
MGQILLAKKKFHLRRWLFPLPFRIRWFGELKGEGENLQQLMGMRNYSDVARGESISSHFDSSKVNLSKKRKIVKEEGNCEKVRVVSRFFAGPSPLEQYKIGSSEDIWDRFKYKKSQQKPVFSRFSRKPTSAVRDETVTVVSEEKADRFQQNRAVSHLIYGTKASSSSEAGASSSSSFQNY